MTPRLTSEGPGTAPVNVGDEVVITAVVESLGHDDAHVFVRIGRTPVQVPVIAIVSREREETPICPKKHHKGTWERGAPPLDRFTDGSGWSCPGMAPDGSACGYERRVCDSPGSPATVDASNSAPVPHA